jgi:hypothetical protein
MGLAGRAWDTPLPPLGSKALILGAGPRRRSPPTNPLLFQGLLHLIDPFPHGPLGAQPSSEHDSHQSCRRVRGPLSVEALGQHRVAHPLLRPQFFQDLLENPLVLLIHLLLIRLRAAPVVPSLGVPPPASLLNSSERPGG